MASLSRLDIRIYYSNMVSRVTVDTQVGEVGSTIRESVVVAMKIGL